MKTTYGVNAFNPPPKVGSLASVCHHHPTLEAARRCEQKRTWYNEHHLVEVERRPTVGHQRPRGVVVAVHR